MMQTINPQKSPQKLKNSSHKETLDRVFSIRLNSRKALWLTSAPVSLVAGAFHSCCTVSIFSLPSSGPIYYAQTWPASGPLYVCQYYSNILLMGHLWQDDSICWWPCRNSTKRPSFQPVFAESATSSSKTLKVSFVSGSTTTMHFH